MQSIGGTHYILFILHVDTGENFRLKAVRFQGVDMAEPWLDFVCFERGNGIDKDRDIAGIGKQPLQRAF